MQPKHEKKNNLMLGRKREREELDEQEEDQQQNPQSNPQQMDIE